MAVSGVSGSGTSIYGNRNVLSGLASGMDTESMIENMTQATRIKIAQQNQKKTLLGWKQTAYQGISSQLIEFSKKYMDYQSPTNLLSSAFYDQSIVTSVGKNNALVSASGKTNSKVEINGVKELATSATHSAQGSLKPGDLVTKDFDISKELEHSKLAGGTLSFQYGSTEYTITLSKGANLSTPEKLAEEINKQLAEAKISGSDSKLSDKISVKVENDQLKFTVTDAAGNEVKLTGAGTTVKEALGLTDDKFNNGGINLADNAKPFTANINKDKLIEKQDTAEFLTNKKITFSFNGQKKEVTLLTDADLERLKKPNVTNKNEEFQKILQEKMDDAFGVNADGSKKITIDRDSGNGRLTFKTNADNILKITGGDEDVVGETSVFGFQNGDGNRLNLNNSLEKLGVKFNGKDSMDLVINGVKIGTYKKDATLSQVMRDINANKEAGINASYSETSNKFVLTSKETGAGSKVEITGADSLAGQLFGEADEHGKDAVINVTVNGEEKELTRPSNEIDIDGLKVTISGTFGYKDGKIDPAEKVTFTSKPDTDKMFEAIKTMVEDYNKIVESVYKEMTTKPNRDYQPLTDEQKKEMSKEQIEKWEEKAKEGLLFADTQLRSLHDALRFVFNPGGEAGAKLRAMGIEPTDNYKDGGKIKLDESKLKAALNSNPEGVKDAFNALASDSADSSIMDSSSKGGVITQLKGVMDRFASTSITKPGILVARAGSPSSPNSMLRNAMKTEMDSIDKILKNLDVKLKKEIDRYNSQFTQLEMLISQMNAQSGQLAGLMGGGM
ncbi:MAG: flagellar filament capping protein FliD [Butyricicoccus pullicaecorum]|nr:flagellar filament capping protein FliD [Butyricicoccus pullicaecorum]